MAAGLGAQTKAFPFAIVRDGSLDDLFTLRLNYRVAWLEQANFAPKQIEFGELARSASAVDREVELVLIAPPYGPDPEVLELESDPPAIRAEIIESGAIDVNDRTARHVPAQRIRHVIRLTVDPSELPMGKFHEHVTARTTCGETKLHLRGEVCTAAAATPASLLVEASRTSPIERVVQLRSRTDEPLVVEAVHATIQGVTCRIDRESNQVSVRIDSAASISSCSAVVIEARVGSELETLHVPVVAF